MRWARRFATVAALVLFGAAAMSWYADPLKSVLLANAWLMCSGGR